ncbi:MAG: TonB-dependent receptor [Edaphobacter sp.]
MPHPHHRKAATLLQILLAAILLIIPAKAAIIRGTVTTPYGVPLGNAKVQLVQGKKAIAYAITQPDGTYEIRSASSGRLVLLATAAPYTPSIGQDFYASATAVVTRNIVMQPTTINPQLATTSSAIPTPLQQVPAAVAIVPQSALTTEVNLLNPLRQIPGVNTIQTGQTGGPIALYVRGGAPTTNEILTDHTPSEEIGGSFDLSHTSTTALQGPELYRGANSALLGTGAEASILSLASARSTTTLNPTVNYTGDGGNFTTYRNEVILSGAFNPIDYLAAFSRLDTSNALPLDRFHSTTEAANVGYAILTNTTARFTLRNTTTATGLPGAHDIYGLSANAKQSNQNLYSSLTVENIWAGNWHNLARYDIARNREQLQQFTPTGQPVTDPITQITTYYGNPITLRGANGYTATGQAAFILPTYDTVSNHDQLYYQSSYQFPLHIAALFSFHYDNERGRLLSSAYPSGAIIKRTNYLYTLQLQGDILHRVTYSLGGSINKNELIGTHGNPRIGLTWDVIRPGASPFRGTLIRANAATGLQEPSTLDQLTSLYTLLQQFAGNTYTTTPITAQRSRTYDIGIDQNILNQKLILKAAYFHNEFNHQLEFIAPNGLEHYFDIPSTIANQIPAASINSLAYAAQGLEAELQYQALSRLFLRGGYTYLDSSVQQSFSSDNVRPVTNPNLPTIPIGALSPLIGQRPFRLPPQFGFFSVEYTATKFSAAIKGALATRSDDSTFQLNNDLNHTNTLLLPNRNLDFASAKLDLNLIYKATSRVKVFTQLDNLLNDQHIGPIGYPGLPFTIRAGLKIRLFGD